MRDEESTTGVRGRRGGGMLCSTTWPRSKQTTKQKPGEKQLGGYVTAVKERAGDDFLTGRNQIVIKEVIESVETNNLIAVDVL